MVTPDCPEQLESSRHTLSGHFLTHIHHTFKNRSIVFRFPSMNHFPYIPRGIPLNFSWGCPAVLINLLALIPPLSLHLYAHLHKNCWSVTLQISFTFYNHLVSCTHLHSLPRPLGHIQLPWVAGCPPEFRTCHNCSLLVFSRPADMEPQRPYSSSASIMPA